MFLYLPLLIHGILLHRGTRGLSSTVPVTEARVGISTLKPFLFVQKVYIRMGSLYIHVCEQCERVNE